MYDMFYRTNMVAIWLISFNFLVASVYVYAVHPVPLPQESAGSCVLRYILFYRFAAAVGGASSSFFFFSFTLLRSFSLHKRCLFSSQCTLHTCLRSRLQWGRPLSWLLAGSWCVVSGRWAPSLRETIVKVIAYTPLPIALIINTKRGQWRFLMD